MHFGVQRTNIIFVEVEVSFTVEALGMGYFFDFKHTDKSLRPSRNPPLLCLLNGKLYESEIKGLLRELNPGPLAPEARIMPLDQAASCSVRFHIDFSIRDDQSSEDNI